MLFFFPRIFFLEFRIIPVRFLKSPVLCFFVLSIGVYNWETLLELNIFQITVCCCDFFRKITASSILGQVKHTNDLMLSNHINDLSMSKMWCIGIFQNSSSDSDIETSCHTLNVRSLSKTNTSTGPAPAAKDATVSKFPPISGNSDSRCQSALSHIAQVHNYPI